MTTEEAIRKIAERATELGDKVGTLQEVLGLIGEPAAAADL
jgi:hypothetical protein